MHRVPCTHQISLASWCCGTTLCSSPVSRSIECAVKSYHHEMDDSGTEATVTWLAVIRGPEATTACLIARPLPGERWHMCLHSLVSLTAACTHVFL